MSRLVVQESRSCVVTVTSDHQYISSSSIIADTSAAFSCGSRSHPWRLQAPVGQRINISLLDFAGSTAVSADRDIPCRQYGYVMDRASKKNASICAVIVADGRTSSRENAVYTSKSNSVGVVLQTATNSNNNFLIKLHGICQKAFSYRSWPITVDKRLLSI